MVGVNKNKLESSLLMCKGEFQAGLALPDPLLVFNPACSFC